MVLHLFFNQTGSYRRTHKAFQPTLIFRSAASRPLVHTQLRIELHPAYPFRRHLRSLILTHFLRYFFIKTVKLYNLQKYLSTYLEISQLYSFGRVLVDHLTDEFLLLAAMLVNQFLEEGGHLGGGS